MTEREAGSNNLIVAYPVQDFARSGGSNDGARTSGICGSSSGEIQSGCPRLIWRARSIVGTTQTARRKHVREECLFKKAAKVSNRILARIMNGLGKGRFLCI